MAEADDGKDMLVKMVRSTGQPVDGESGAAFNPNDDLTDDFVRGKFFQIESFDFGAGLDDDDSPKETKETKDGKHAKGEPETKKSAKAAGPTKLKYARFLTANDVRPGRGYPVDIDTIGFSRMMDRGSTLLFQDMCALKTFESLTLVKRRSIGSTAGMQSYLRLDFTDVLLVGLDWKEGEVIREDYKFICRGVMVQYKPQNSDGTLGAAIPGGWPQAQS